MITKVKLHRFKKFRESEISLGPLSVLIGENSSGKTTVLQAVNLALNMLSAYDFIQPQTDGSIRIREKGVGLTQLPGMASADLKEIFYAKVFRGGSSGGAGGASITLEDSDENSYRLQINALFGAFNIKCTSRPADFATSPRLHQKPPLYISGFIGLRTWEERAYPRVIQDRLRLGNVSAIIRNILVELAQKSPERYTALKDRLAKEFDFHLGTVDFDEEHDLYVKGAYNEVCDSRRLSLDFTSSGSGFMQILQILAPIYSYCPSEANIVLLDEPDAHLHVNLQASLANALRSIQRELGIQILISTHSTAIIRAAAPSEVVPISAAKARNKSLGSSSEVEEQISSRIDTYSLAKAVLSGKLVFLEDSNTKVLEHMDRVLGTRSLNGANTVPMLKGRGKDDKIPFHIKEVLRQAVAQDVEIVFIRDGDALPDAWRESLSEFALAKGVRLYILHRHEIESYLLVPDLIRRAIDDRHGANSGPSRSQLQNKIIELLKNTISLNRYGFEDVLEDAIYKTALVLGKSEYRNPQLGKSEAKEIRERAESLTTFEDLVQIGMGKETLAGILNWLSADLGLALNQADILDAMQAEDVPTEIEILLRSLRSKAAGPTEDEIQAAEEQPGDNPDDEDPVSQDSATRDAAAMVASAKAAGCPPSQLSLLDP